MKEVVLAGACRTPIGKFQGGLSSFRAPELGGLAIAEALRRSGVPAEAVEEVLMGNVLQAGLGQNPARQAARAAGIPDSVGSTTINKVCGSGLKSVMLAVQAIRAGDAECLVAGGMENMTMSPYLLPGARAGQRLGHGEMLDSMVHDGLWDIYNDFHMGMTAELVADKYEIDRRAQDEFAAESHRKASEATAAGRFDEEKFTISVPQRKKDPIAFTTDETIREGMTADSLAKLRPAFKRDGGSVTAANASAINDGAAAMVVMSADKAKELGVKPLARVTGYGTGGMAPEWVMMAPEKSITTVSQKLNMKPSDFDLHEINEAFSAAACALTRVLDLDASKVNVNGGAVALGHPIGASGARILVTLLHAMKQRDAKTGMASLCLGGGNAVSLAVESLVVGGSSFKSVAVVGAGTMGNGIAQTFATYGAEVLMIDLDGTALERGKAAIDKSLARVVKKEKITEEEARAISARVLTTSDVTQIAKQELVVEAVSEKQAVKAAVFQTLDSNCPEHTILATNTSSISITEIAAVTKRPEKVIGMHFMNPVPIMKLVEVIRGQLTSDETTARVMAASESIGKVPVEAQDYPGFVSNRVLMPMINEAVFCLMEGVSTREGIDTVMKLGMAHPMGPLALADLIGLDVCLDIMEVLHSGLGDSKYRPCPLLRRMVAAGRLGKKSGAGFYDYE